MTDRTLLTKAFLARTRWAGMPRVPLAGDASNRKYDRLSDPGTGETAVLMDADPQKGEDVRPFCAIARHLRALGLSAPEIYAENSEDGFLLLEDLGDDLFARILARSPRLEAALYQTAVDLLVTLHGAPPPELECYAAPMMTRLASLAFTCYRQTITGSSAAGTQARFEARFEKVLHATVQGPRALILRDYHAENLLWLPRRAGIARVGLLDFQDAMLGHPAYDLVSLLQDARRSVPAETEEAMIARYLTATGIDGPAFRAAYAVLGAQRNLRILSVFARLATDRGRPQYVALIPRVWAYLMRDLAHPALTPVAEDLLTALPAPSEANLQRLKLA